MGAPHTMSAIASVKCAFCDHIEPVQVTLTLSGLHEGYVGVRAEVPPDAAAVATERFREHLASVHSMTVDATAQWPSTIPGVDAAARVGLDIANRSIRYAGKETGKAVEGLMEKFSDEQRVANAMRSGEYAGKGAIGAEWFERIAAALAKTNPAPPNVVNNVTIVRPTRRWWQFWKRANV